MPADALQARVTQHFHVAEEDVFDAWLDPDALGSWMFGPDVRDEEIVRLTLDPKVGGAFSFVVRRQGTELNHIGTYLEMERPTRLAFTWGVDSDPGDTSRVDIDIVPDGDGCELMLVHHLAPEWRDYVKPTETAWKKMLYTLARTFQG